MAVLCVSCGGGGGGGRSPSCLPGSMRHEAAGEAGVRVVRDAWSVVGHRFGALLGAFCNRMTAANVQLRPRM